MIGGHDGHGEKFEIRRRIFNLTQEEIENLTLGELKTDGSLRYYEPTPGFMIYVNGLTDQSKILTPVLSTEHTYLSNGNVDRTWLVVTFTGKPSENVEEETEETEETEWEKSGYKREFIGSNGDYIETVSSIEYQGSAKKQKPVVKVSWNGKTFSSGKGGNLNVKYSKCTNAGTVTVTIKKVKGKANKDANNALKGKTITYIVAPVTVSNNNIQPKVKNGKVKSVKVMTGGKYKKVPKKMWSFSGKELTFSGNYKGKVSVNGI